MKTKTIFAAVLALGLAASSSAFAQRGDQNDHRDRGDYSQRDNGRHDNNHDRRDDNRGQNDHRYDNRGQGYHRDDSRGAGPRHDMRRGGRLSNEYRGRQYVVNDWRTRRLSAPPRGQHWVRAGDDYVLAAIATGIITQVLLNN